MLKLASRTAAPRLARLAPIRTLAEGTQGKFHPLVTDSPPAPPEERPFVWKLRGFLTWTVIPGFMAYQVFVADFGSSEHVFSPARRWLAQQKARFYTLDPAERELAKDGNSSNHPEATGETQ